MISLKITKTKLFMVIGTIAILMAQWGISAIVINKMSSMGSERTLWFISALSSAAIIFHFLTWNKLTGELLCPYIVFLTVLFMFCCGQAVGWSLGLDMGSKNMWARGDHGIDKALLARGLRYSMLGITAFHLGALIGKKDRVSTKIVSKWTTEKVETAFAEIGKIILIFCVPAFLAILAQNLSAVASGGYSAYYETNQSRSAIMRVINIFAEFYQPCLLILLISHRDAPSKRRLIITAMMVDVVAELYIGGRSGAVMTLLGIILAYHYFIKPFAAKQAVIGIAGGYVVLAVLNAVAGVRRASNRGLGDMMAAIGGSFTNVIGEFLGEQGWNITSICWTMNLVDSGSYPLRHGMSYLVSTISWIPTSLFGGRHPAVVWGNLADWLQNALRMSYGPGYTMIAESYLNFGKWGLLALFVEGFIVIKLIGQVSRKHVENNMLGATFELLFIMTVMKALIRSSTTVATRIAFFVMLPMYLLIHIFLLRKNKEK